MSKQKKGGRRNFLAGLGLMASAGVAAKLAPPVAGTVSTTPSAPEGDGYRLTDHVKKYYRTTTI